MIIDCHVHAGKGDGLRGPWNTDAPLEPYLRRARAAGIDRAVIFSPLHTDYAQANAATARLAARYPGFLIPFAFVHAQRDAGRIREMVRQAVVRWGFRGIKVHKRDAPATREICEAARAFGVPVLYDVVGDPSLVEMIAPQYPDVNFIIPHLGSFADDYRAHVGLIDQLTRLPNVYTDTAGVRRFDYLVEAIRRAGPHKVLFGSDGPWLHPALELQKIRLLRLSPEAESLVLGRNILRLIAHSAKVTHSAGALPAPAVRGGPSGTLLPDGRRATPAAPATARVKPRSRGDVRREYRVGR
jgi:predicted TIM-barrel fold metal-dependent hydrolase